MKYFVLSVLVAAVAARPEPPLQAYGPPSVQLAAPVALHSAGPPSPPIPVAAPSLNPAQTYLLSPVGGSHGGGQVVSSYHAAPSGPVSAPGASFHNHGASGGFSQAQSLGGHGGGSSFLIQAQPQVQLQQQQQHHHAPQQQFQALPQQYQAPQLSHHHHHSQSHGLGASFAQAGPAPQQSVVQKHIYVHVPPPETEEQFNSPAQYSGGARQKHYKIIFIKAPSYGGQQFNSPSVYNSPVEEKTLVYVLVKKNEPQLDLASPAVQASHVPSKPEVYFIKYRSSQGAANAAAAAIGGGADRKSVV